MFNMQSTKLQRNWKKTREKLGKCTKVEYSGKSKILELVIATNSYKLLPSRRPIKWKQENRVTKDLTSTLGWHEFGTQ